VLVVPEVRVGQDVEPGFFLVPDLSADAVPVGFCELLLPLLQHVLARGRAYREWMATYHEQRADVATTQTDELRHPACRDAQRWQ
jgi:hypothetical protein